MNKSTNYSPLQETKATLTAYLLDTVTGKSGPVEVERSLNSYYEAMHCDLITICYLPIDGKEYCVICDDEGLFKLHTRVSAVNLYNLDPMIVGSILICSADDPDDTGDFVSLSADDIARISRQVITASDALGNYPVVLIG